MIVPSNIPESGVDDAKARGISVKVLVREKIETFTDTDSGEFPGLMPLVLGSMTSAELGARIKVLRKGR